VNLGLAEWVKAGGTLLLVGGEDPYNDIGEWWNRNGFASPQDHLLQHAGVTVDLARRTVHSSLSRFTPLFDSEGAGAAAPIEIGAHAAGGKAVYLRFTGAGGSVRRLRLRDGAVVRAEFTPGSPAEKPFLQEDSGSRLAGGTRLLEGDAAFIYRFNRLSPRARLELETEGAVRVSVTAGADPAMQLLPGSFPLPPQRAGTGYPVVTYVPGRAEALYRLPGDAGAPAWLSSAGSGTVLFCGLPAAFGADSMQGADLVRALTRLACSRAGIEYVEAPMIARRGPFVIAHAQGRTAQLKGSYVDLLDPDLRVVDDPHLPYLEPVFYRAGLFNSRLPTLLHATHRATVLEGGASRMRVRLDGPKDAPAVLRVFPAGMSLISCDAVTSTGEPVPAEAVMEGRTLRVRTRRAPTGVTVTLRWLRPEARLTK
jgi:hypothetical protein